jgi:hypothetical protein
LSENSEQSEKYKPEDHNWFIRWKHTWSGRIAWTVLDLAIAYVFASLAIDSGTLWQWGIAIFFAIDGLYNFARLVGKVIRRTSANRT